MPKLDHFGWVAPHYERLIRVRADDDWEQRLDLPISGWLLDAGGGTGRVSQWFAGKTGGLIIADESIGMLRQAKNMHHLTTACTHTEHLPFPTGFFERIIMVDAFHHVGHQQHTALELLRVLRPGGKLVIEEPDIRSIWVKGIAVAEKLMLMRSNIISAQAIAALYNHQSVETRIARTGTTVWVTVTKINS